MANFEFYCDVHRGIRKTWEKHLLADFVVSIRIVTCFDICTLTTNDNPLITALGHGTHY